MPEVFYGKFNAAPRMHGQETGGYPVATPLTSREVNAAASAVLGEKNPALPRDKAEWIDKRVHGIRYKGVNILTVDWDGVHEPVADTTMQQFLKSKNVSGVVVEYFTPELAARAKAVPILGGYLEKQVTSPAKEKDLKGRAHYRNQYKRRLYFGKTVTESLAQSGKPALCFDIANKPTYMLLRDGAVLAETVIGRSIGRSVDVSYANRGIDTQGRYTKLGGDIPMYWWFSKLLMQVMKKGIYDPKNLSALDGFQLHLEDARRLVIAEGLLQNIDRNVARGNLKAGDSLLVVYPEAHNLRIRNYMERLTKKDGGTALKVKDLAYRLVSDPILEFKERQYHFDNGAWRQTGAHPITRQA